MRSVVLDHLCASFTYRQIDVCVCVWIEWLDGSSLSFIFLLFVYRECYNEKKNRNKNKATAITMPKQR